ncbi:hypothetical protein TWF694_001937 [Orbilia ellipsospora]|uniref:Uncharacterized protein n=1 Tax=Orbilia ellipsospora TaxID=2528407 RepID=A0AAV9X597_9PEZI
MDPQESLQDPVAAPSGAVSTSRKRRLSPTCDKDSMQLSKFTPSLSENRGSGGLDRHYISTNIPPEDNVATSGVHYPRYRLVACGCNSHGQLDYHRDRSIVPDNYTNAPPFGDSRTSGSAEEDAAAATVTPTRAAREPSLFTTLETPTVIMTASDSMRILYVGVDSICGE